MATEQKNAEAHCTNESRTWPVSLLGCLQDTSHTSQLAWPWLMLKACLCPASVLGANETLFQGEEAADVCCLQPYSFCGPTCRGLNTQLCGLGNEGLKLCAQTCLLQAACSCLCLGLPYVAWLSALQRQRVMAKHGVAVTEEDAWATACYPCSLLQMHALLQQQQQHHQHPQHSPRHPQQQHQAQSAPLRAPKLQHMTACASEAPSQASSYAGPLTSAMTSSKVMRAVRDQATRSDSAAPPGGHGAGSNRLGPRDSLDSTGSSMASETGVVNSPMVEKQQQQQPEFQDLGPDSSRSNSRGDVSARHSNRRTSARNSSEGAGSKQQQRPPSSGGTSHLRPPPPAAQQQLGPLMSARSHSSNGGAVFSTQHSMLPPRPGPARHCRAASLGSDIAASAAADAASTAASARCSDSDMVGPALQGQTPEPASSSKRKLPGRAALASQSCHLPNGFHSSTGMGLQGGALPTTPPQASSTSAAAAGGTPWLSNSVEPGTLQAQQQGAMAVGTPPIHMHSSCSKASMGGSCSRLVTFSQEDVPLSAFKPNPGKANRRSSTGTCAGVSSSAASAGALGWGGYGSKAGSLTGSLQQQQQGQGHAEGSSQPGSCGNGGGGGGLSVEGVQPPAQQQQHGGPTGGGSGALHAAPAGLALLVASNAAEAAEARGGWQQQVDPQYTTMQSDICNYASWLEEPAPGHSTCAINQQQQLLDAGSQLRQEQQVPQQERSEGDMCNYEEPTSPPACSPKQAVSPATLSATKASSSPDTAAAETGDAAGVSAAAAAAAAAVGGRPTVLAAAWAYMSDMCNLGGSFDATSSTIGRSGLAAAVLSRFAADNSQQQQQEGGTLEGSQGRPSSGSVSGRPSSSSSNGRKQQPAPGTAAAAAAAGSWPDTAPSPPHATLVAGSAADCTTATAAGSGAVAAVTAAGSAHASGRGPAAACVSAAQADGCSRALAAAPPAGIASRLRLPDSAAAAEAGSSGRQGADDEEEEVSSPPRRKRRGAAGGAYPSDSGVERFTVGQPEDHAAAARRGLISRSSSNGGAGATTSSNDTGSGRDEAAVAAAAPSAVEGLDPQLLAAVTGTTSRDQLTASQEELAAKLARLAFANPASARQLAGAPPQQQQRQEQRRTPHDGSAVAVGSGDGRQQQHEQQARQQFEPFYPTVMSDMCNLADPDGEEPEERLERQGSQTNMRATGRAAAGSLQQHQQWQATAAAAGAVHGPMRPPAAAAAYKPQLPGRPIRQQAQQQQFVGAASRLGRSAMGGAGPPSSNSSTAAAASAAGVGDTAGPLRAALLLRGMRAAPGGPKQLPTGANGNPVNPAAAGILSRRMASPGDVAGDAGSAGAAACGSGGGVGGVLSMHAPHGEESLVSFDSYYVDCDLRQPGDAAAMDAANMITNNPLYTFTASEGGGTADSTRFSPGLKQQLRDASDVAAEEGGGPGRGSPPYMAQQQQQWHDPGVVRGGKVGMGPAAAGGGGGPAGSYEGRNTSSSEHDDGVRQYDNSRSSSPALQMAADGGAFAAATAAVAGKVSKDFGSKDEVVGGEGSGYMGSLQGSAGARSKRQHRDVGAPGRDAAY